MATKKEIIKQAQSSYATTKQKGLQQISKIKNTKEKEAKKAALNKKLDQIHAVADNARGFKTYTVTAPTKSGYAQKPIEPKDNYAYQNLKPAKLPVNTSAKLPVNTLSKQSTLRFGVNPALTKQEKATAAERNKQKLVQETKNSPVARGIAGYVAGFSPIKAEFAPEVQKNLKGSTAFKVGEIAGIGTQFALPYAGVGKGVVSTTTKVLPRALPMLSKVGTKGIQKVLPVIGEEAAKKFGTRAAESLVKDIAIGLPLNVNQAYNKDNLRGKEAAKSIGLNTALDIGVGGALEIAPILLKSGKKVKNKGDFDQLSKGEKKEVEEEIRKADFYSTPGGSAMKKPYAGLLPSPNKNTVSPMQQETDKFTKWRKENFGGAFGKMSKEDNEALLDLYHEMTGIDFRQNIRNIDAVKNGKETPFTITKAEQVLPISKKISQSPIPENMLPKNSIKGESIKTPLPQNPMKSSQKPSLPILNKGTDTPIKQQRVKAYQGDFDRGMLDKADKEYKDFIEDMTHGEATGGTGIENFAQNISSKNVGRFNDTQRNADYAFKNDKEGREWFKQVFEDNFYKSKGENARNVKDKLDVIYKDVVKGRGIKKGSKESAAVQWIGEGQKQIVDGNNTQTKAYTLQDLKEEFNYKMPNGKMAWQNIAETNVIMRGMYDDFLNRINNSLRKIYPNVEQEVTKMESKKIGKSLEERKTIDAEIDRYITGKRLRPRQDYYHHFTELQNGFFNNLDTIINGATNIDPRLIGVTEFTKPNSKWTGMLQHRSKNAGYTADAVGGMLNYIPQAEYKINIEPNIPVLRNIVKDLKESTADSRNANSFIETLMQTANELAGKQNPLDRAVLNIVGDEKGRKVLNSLSTVSNRIRANAVVGNANTVLAQFFNMPNVAGYAKNPIDIVNGMVTATKAMMGNSEAKAILEKSDFLRERYLDRSMRRFDDGILNNLNNFLSWTMEVGDKAVSDSAFITFYNQAIKNGLPEEQAILKADEFTRKSVAGRGIGEIPLSQKAKVTKLIAPFQVEVRNAVNVLKDLGYKKDISGIMGLFATTFAMNTALEATTGRRIGLDPIYLILETVREAQNEDKPKGEVATNALTRLGGDILTNYPGGSYVAELGANALGLDDYAMKRIFGQSDPSRFGTGNIALQTLGAPIGQALRGQNIDLLKPAMSVLPKFGGKQIERGIRGLQDMAAIPRETLRLPSIKNKGELNLEKQPYPASVSPSGNIRFPINPSAKNYIIAPTLGTWATKEGKDYIEQSSGTGQMSNDAIDILDIPKRKLNKINQERQRVSEITGNEKVFMSPVKNTITRNDQKYNLRTKEYFEYQKMVAEESYKNTSKLLGSKEYENMNQIDKAKAIQKINEEAKHNAQNSILLKRGAIDELEDLSDKQKEKYYKYAEDAGINKKIFSTTVIGASKIKSDPLPNGKSKENASKKKKAYINEMNPNATREQLKILYEAAGVSQSIGHYRKRFD